MFNNNLFIFFVIVLVISITPVSAELIGGSFSDGVNPDLAGNETGNVTAVDDYNTTLNIVEQDLDELKSHMDPLNEDLDYIEKRRGDFGWKFWEWPGIIYDIIETLYKIPSKAEGIEEPASKLQVDINKLNNTLLQAKSLGSDSCDGNASYMATELSQRLNTTVTASAVSASDLQEGDVVQYLSQGKYSRYLKVMSITRQNSTTKQNNTVNGSLKSNTQGNGIPTEVLLGALSGLVIQINLKDNQEFYKINSPGTNTTTLLKTSAEIQVDDLEKIRNNAKCIWDKSNQYEEQSKELLKDAGIVTGAGAIAMAAALFITAITFGAGAPLIAVAAGIIVLLAPCIVTLLLAALIYHVLSQSYADDSCKLSDNAQCNENDLCSYVEEITQQSMNITALEGVPVINQTTIPDWKNYEFTLINNAAHGTVLPGPGIQFLYGPDEGYTGNDQFTFQYSQNGQPRGIMTVNVTISPIPVIPVPNEGGEY